MSKVKIYSPNQIAVSTFLGGPGAMIFVLKKNFDTLGKKTESKTTVIVGLLFIVLLLVVMPFLPEKFPHVAVPAGYTAAAITIAKKQQMSKQAILDSQQFEFQSAWNVLGISIGFLIAFLIVIVLWTFGLQMLGIDIGGSRA